MSGSPAGATNWSDHLEAKGLPRAAALKIAALARPNVRLARAQPVRDGLPSGSSRFGGEPDLATDTPWPVWRRGHPDLPGPDANPGRLRALDFLAQINLADIAATGFAERPFPATGLLSLFFDREEQPSGLEPGHRWAGRVLHQPLTDLAPRPCPPRMTASPAFAMRMNAGDSLPDLETPELTALFPDKDVWDDIEPRLLDLIDDDSEPQLQPWGHALGGWPKHVLGDMAAECQLVEAGLTASDPSAFASPQGRKALAVKSDWRLVLQLACDPALDWNWGDEGRLFVWMREADLQAGRFANARFLLQSF